VGQQVARAALANYPRVETDVASGPRVKCTACGHFMPVARVVAVERRRWLVCTQCGAMATWELDATGDDVVDLRAETGAGRDGAAVERFVEAMKESLAVSGGAADLLDKQWDVLSEAERRELVGLAVRRGDQFRRDLLPLLAKVLSARVPFGTPEAAPSVK